MVNSNDKKNDRSEQSSKHSSKRNKSSKSKKKKGQRTSNFAGPSEGLTWFNPGKTMTQFWNDPRFQNREVTATFKGGMVNPSIKLKFDTPDERGISLQHHEMGASEYLKWRAKQVDAHRARQEQDSWDTLVKKLSIRLKIDLKKEDRPKIFTSKAKSFVLDQLTPFERAVLNLSQSNWNKVDDNRLSAQHKEFGKNSLTQRKAAIVAYLTGQEFTKPDLVRTEQVAFNAKSVLAITERQDVPKEA